MSVFRNYSILLLSFVMICGAAAIYSYTTLEQSKIKTSLNILVTPDKNTVFVEEAIVNTAPKLELEPKSPQPKVQKKSYELTDPSKFNLDIPVLMYHHIDTIPAGFENDAIAVGLRVSPQAFDVQMNTLKNLGHTTLHIDEYEQITLGLKPAPTKSVLITLDDGYTDNFTQALPILQKYNLIGNFAIVT
jgi:Polysaccharide deacetylase